MSERLTVWVAIFFDPDVDEEHFSEVEVHATCASAEASTMRAPWTRIYECEVKGRT